MFIEKVFFTRFVIRSIQMLVFLSLITNAKFYLILVNETTLPGDVIFDASIYSLDYERHYSINHQLTAPFVHSFLYINQKNGQIILRETVYCDGLHYPQMFSLYIDSTSKRLQDVEYYSLSLTIVIIGDECDIGDTFEKRKNPKYSAGINSIENSQLYKQKRISFNNVIPEAWNRITETHASISISKNTRQKCLRKSQYVNTISSLIPKTIQTHCYIDYLQVSDNRFKIEKSQGDLVASDDICLTQPMWKVVVFISIKCHDILILDSKHRIKVVYHNQIYNDTDIAKRVRREIINQSPFFEQHLYIASVLEECDPGIIVTSVKARDPENSPIIYSMTSLLDSRTQNMFDIDSKSGTITTKVRLDRELVDVHYFRVVASDDGFRSRSGTTMLQVNVLDANDHSPVFEMNEYEASIREGVTVGTTVITLKATDQDILKNGEVEYSLKSITVDGIAINEEYLEHFKIDSKSGVISTRTMLDRELTEIYSLIVQASDLASPQNARRSSSATVLIKVLDENDNYPQFSEKTYSVTVKEDVNWLTGHLIATIRASDADQGNNAAIRYAIIGGNTQSQFAIDSLSGDVSVVKPLDYETLRSYRLIIRAQDGGSPMRSNTTQLLVNVKDVNDNMPRFYTSLFQESVSENVPSGHSIVKVQAYDADDGPNAEIKYTISPRDAIGTSTEDLPLSIDSHSGWIYTSGELDREQQSKYVFQVIAADQGIPSLSASVSVVIIVQDINDNNPIFEPKIYEALISEDDPPGTPVATVTATDMDEDNRLHYELTNGNVRGRFTITSQNGKGLITVAQPLDYKQEKKYILIVTASDSGGKTDIATVLVNISDANNFAPVFENAPYSSGVFEDAAVGTTVLVVSAIDNDVGINAQITYSLGEELNGRDGISTFSINSQTGAIFTNKPLDREIISGYLLTVTARDGGSPSLSDTTDVEITVADVNDNFPIFKQQSYSGSVLEDALIGTSVIQVLATDTDIGLNGRIRYTLSDKDVEDGSFVIDPISGVIRTNKGLDRESVAFYDLEAYAIDRGSPSLSSSVPVQIRIEDINDNPPSFESDKITLYISENSPIGSTVGDIYAKDPDEGINAIVQYSITGGDDSQYFSLITRPGSSKAELLTMTELDYESRKKQYDLVVRAASPPLRSDVHVEIIITDVNDNAPVLKDFIIFFNNFKDHFPTGPIGIIPANDADVSDKLKYKILSGNNANLVALNESTGKLQLSPQLNANVPKIASMEVSVSDGVNEVKAIMQLICRLITEEMLLNSITVRLNKMTKEAFLSPLLSYFVDGLAAIIPCPKENIFIFSIQDDTDVTNVQVNILNISFSAKRPDVTYEEFYSPQFLQERIYLNRAILNRLSTVEVLPFDDNLCVSEPCLNFEECLTVLKFGNASSFINSETVLFRPIYPVTAFTCQCPKGFTGLKEHYLCDTEVNLCYSAPCQNNGTCKRREGGYTCICTPEYTGVNCEIKIPVDVCKSCTSERICNTSIKCGDCTPMTDSEHYTHLCELRSRSFTRYSFLTFPSLKQRNRLHLHLRFATQLRNGLLLYNGRYNELHDFISLEIVESSVQFSFSLGDYVTRTVASIPGGVSNGEWHTVDILFFNKTATVSLDNCDTALALKHGEKFDQKWSCTGSSTRFLESKCISVTETCHRFLDLTGPLQLGGLPTLPASFQPFNHHFEGCISDFKIDHRFVNLNSFVADNGTSVGCPQKRSFCSSEPCKNGGDCKNGWNMFHCNCLEGFGGKDCAEIISKPWSFSGDGMLSFNPLLRPIQLPWLNAVSVRTLQRDAFIMSIQIGQNNTAVLFLKSEFLHYTYNDESFKLNSNPISDGNWHRLEVTWLGTEVKLSVDYGQQFTVYSYLPKIQGMYVGKISIGGLDNMYSSRSWDYNFLEGCIKDVRIGNYQTLLNRPTVKENVDDGCFSIDDCQSKCTSTAVCVTKWRSSYCECKKGFVGSLCIPACNVDPCEIGGVCIEDSFNEKGYKCKCNSSLFSGEYCEEKVSQPCPAGWWGYPVCGPCNCDITSGYHPDCDKTTGECHCREHHYRPAYSKNCLPCDCYLIGSSSAQCDHQSGNCKCKEGVVGQKCDSCSNPYAEITLRGCEVIYDGCPKSSSDKIWWSRTKFGLFAVERCPVGSQGKASRFCDNRIGKWQEPDLFNCTTDKFIELKNQLSLIENGDLQLDTFVAIKLASDLHKVTNLTQTLYGADVLITRNLLHKLLTRELLLKGLNLTHSQDKDFIKNIVGSSNIILDKNYKQYWSQIEELTSISTEDFVQLMQTYIDLLASSQHDTYTNPFEISSNNVVLGLDIITADSLFGYQSKITPILLDNLTYTSPKVKVPDTFQFTEYLSVSPVGPLISFPKYNNYIQDHSKFDKNTRILVPIKLLGIEEFVLEESITKHSLSENKAVVSYVQYKQVGFLFPEKYDDSVEKRWGVDIVVGSPLISVSILIPNFIKQNSEHFWNSSFKTNQNHGKKTIERQIQFKERRSYLRQVKKRVRKEYTSKKILMYKTLMGERLEMPIKLQIWLDPNITFFNERSNPQCVFWSTVRGYGEWSRVGCRTEINVDWFRSYNNLPTVVNCTCDHLSTYAVLVNVVDSGFIRDSTSVEDLATWGSFCISLPLLLISYLILVLIRGLQTNSNNIKKNLVLCLFLAEFLFVIAMKTRIFMVNIQIACKLVAISLHYLWLAAFAWMLVDGLHLYRMLTEMRDINHGSMKFYYFIGYVLPAIVVSLAVGVRAHQYGNYYFCWVSIYESVIWSLIGPICLIVFINIVILILAIKAAFTLQDHVLGFGNLRTLLWVSVVLLPLMSCVCVMAILVASEQYPILIPLLSVAVLVHAIFSIGGYCFANARVRQNVTGSLLKCMGKKIPLLEATSAAGLASISSHNINFQSHKSGMSFGGSGTETRRHIGISTSSTTSRSTTKTNSSPYRSDAQLRHTSTSTSNYNSASDVPYYMRQFEKNRSNRRHNEKKNDQSDRRRESDSESDCSEGRSLDLASSHSSDDDESSTNRNQLRNAGTSSSRRAYLPNITEHIVARCGTPPPLNILTNSQLFPAVSTIYSARWTSQLPESYIANTVPEISRWSAETGSDNELSQKEHSPNPLPNPDMLSETMLPRDHLEQYVGRINSHFISTSKIEAKFIGNKMSPKDDTSDMDEKHHDKYSFPYTAEEDHVASHASSRMPSPTSNELSNTGSQYQEDGVRSRIISRIDFGSDGLRGSPPELLSSEEIGI